MAVIFFAFLAIIVHGFPSKAPRDSSAEDLFSMSNPYDIDDSTLVPSLISEDYTSSNLLDPDPSVFTPDFFQDYSPTDQPLAMISEDPTQNLFEDPTTGSDPSYSSFDSLAATTNYESENDASIPTSNCEQSGLDTGDLFAEQYDSKEDSSISVLARSAPVVNADDNIRKFKLKGRQMPDGGTSIRVLDIPGSSFDLDPNTSPDTGVSQAYAADGTPLRPKQCPNGTKRSCCKWDSFPPFSQCWPHAVNMGVCRSAKNQFCCASILNGGSVNTGVPSTGLDCQDMKWQKSRDGRKQRAPSSLESPTSNQLQEIFPILQPLPDLSPSNPDFCSIRRRR